MWLLKMAWRDSRRSRSRLFLFVSSIIMGVAALVAINSFSDNLQKDIEGQAKTLLGADLVLNTNQPVSEAAQELLDSIAGLGEQGTEYSFSSMVYFPKTGNTRLTQVKAVEGNYPFYGTTKVNPENASTSFKTGQKAIVEQTMMIQFGAKNGDTVEIGGIPFVIEGTLISRPGRAGVAGSVAPMVMIPMQYLEQTGLVQTGSRVDYSYAFKFPERVEISKLLKATEDRFKINKLRYETVEMRKEGVGEAFSNLNDFLSLVSFIALLLGCIGVASAVHIYVKEKLSTVAILRCMGVSGRQAFLIYLIQIAIMGLIGATIGAFLGSGIQIVLPLVLKDFLPIDNISSDLSLSAVGQGIGIGLIVSILFALLPLITIRKTSPLRTLRASYEEGSSIKDVYQWGVYLLIVLFVVGFAYWQIGDLIGAVAFSISVVVAFLMLAGIAQLIMWLVRRFFPKQWSFVWRQGLANLYRPNNQTLILTVAIGLGTTLIATLFFIQGLLLSQVELSGAGDQPNMILFDIQTPQKEGVAKLVKEQGLPILQQVPIVTIRLQDVNGKTKNDNDADSTKTRLDNWVYNREYRVTYRDTLIDSEEIVEGKWVGEASVNEAVIPVSIEQGFAEDLQAKVGDEITFNVQGALMKTKIASIRKVDWSRVQTNFFVVFPKGILEQAPQFHVLISKVKDEVTSAKFQQALVQRYPNVSAIDLTLILKTVEDILSKVSFVIRFMALFSILTGILVLISSLVISKFQRVQESVLLRTLGAVRRQILSINFIEYALLGSIAALTGVVLSVGASWALAVFVFKIPFIPNIFPVLILMVLIVALVVGIAMLNSREVLNKPPLAILRAEQ